MRPNALPQEQRSRETTRPRSRKLKRAVERGDDEIADAAIRDRLVRPGIENLEIEQVLAEMESVPRLAFAGAEADFVGAVIVVNRAAPQLLHLAPEAAFEIGAEECGDVFRLELADVAAELLPCRLGEAQEIFRKAHPDVGAAFEGELELAAARRDDAAAAGDGQHAQVMMARGVEGPAQHRH
jgi:hypothetical protein